MNLAICSTNLLESCEWRFDRVEDKFFTEYLLYRLGQKPEKGDKFTTAIREAVDAAIKVDGTDDGREKYTRSLLSAAVRHMKPRQIIGHLNEKALSIAKITHLGLYHVSDSLFAAGAVLGKPELLKDASDFDLSINNQFFGFPLAAAAKAGHHHLFTQLYSRIGKDGSRLDISEALMSAATRGDSAIVECIMESSCFIVPSRLQYERAVISAATGGHSHILFYLTQSSIETDIFELFKHHLPDSKDLRTRVLNAAAKGGHITLIRRCLREGFEYPELLHFALEYAVQNGHIDAVRVLASAIKKTAFCFEKVAQYAICLAARLGYISMLNIFFSNLGAQLHQFDSNQPHPLVMAAKCGQADVVEFLLDSSPDFKKCKDFDKISHCAIRLAAGRGYESTINVLIDALVPLDEKARKSTLRWPLFIATVAGRTRVVKLLLEHGAEAVDPKTTRWKDGFESGRYPLEESMANEDADTYGCPYPGTDLGCDGKLMWLLSAWYDS